MCRTLAVQAQAFLADLAHAEVMERLWTSWTPCPLSCIGGALAGGQLVLLNVTAVKVG